jgi:diacylglycerol kinase family enzyme
MKARVIFNPYASRWDALRRKPRVEVPIQAAGIDYELVQPKSSGEIIGLAEIAAREGDSPIIAAGGDGTFGEVVNGMYRVKPDGEIRSTNLSDIYYEVLPARLDLLKQ